MMAIEMTEFGPRAQARPEPEVAVRPASLADLFREQYQPMIRLAYLLTGSQAVAEDLVQDSFARIHQKWDGIEQPGAYLRTSVVNACRAHHRRSFREKAKFPDLIRTAVSPETPLLTDALAKLPYKIRAAIVLRYYEDWPEAEIADALHCRPATVRSHIHRGMEELRKVIEK